jgi:probable dihydroxyacetone kinase regulator
MEQKRELTRRLIASAFKTLVMQHPFEKITIKMIADEAGMIRPTFYNYFQDKYELAEWIFTEEIAKEVRLLLGRGMRTEALKLFITCLNQDKPYYRKLFEISGPNSMEDVMMRFAKEMFQNSINEDFVSQLPNTPVLTKDFVAEYYAVAFISYIKIYLINNTETLDSSALTDAFLYLVSHKIF